jgi:hypothetical protein
VVIELPDVEEAVGVGLHPIGMAYRHGTRRLALSTLTVPHASFHYRVSEPFRRAASFVTDDAEYVPWKPQVTHGSGHSTEPYRAFYKSRRLPTVRLSPLFFP